MRKLRYQQLRMSLEVYGIHFQRVSLKTSISIKNSFKT